VCTSCVSASALKNMQAMISNGGAGKGLGKQKSVAPSWELMWLCVRCVCVGAKAFTMFQEEMSVLLRELKERGALDPDDQDIATQLCRVLQEHPDISEARVLSEIGILFVEGFETTGGSGWVGPWVAAQCWALASM